MSAPVMNSDLSEARNRATFAISSGLPILDSGVSDTIESSVSRDSSQFISVLISPGEMELTRILLCPSSFANALVKPIRPALEAEYATSHEAPVLPQMDDILIMLPYSGRRK